MDHETNHQTNHQFRRMPKGERRVRFADSMGMDQHQLPPPKTITKQLAPNITTRPITTSHTPTKTTPTSIVTATQPQTLAVTNNFPTANYSKPTTLLTSSNNNNNSSSTINQHDNQQNVIKDSSNKSSALCSASHLSSSNNSNSNSISTSSAQKNNNSPTSYICQFTQPISLISFKERVKLNKVHLESCSINSVAGNISVSCTIRVLNQSYDKSVIVRYTTDEWHTYTDSLASYKPGSCDGWSDKFTSTFSVTNQVKQFQTGQRIIFAVKYTSDGQQVFWDSNGGLNYSIKKI